MGNKIAGEELKIEELKFKKKVSQSFKDRVLKTKKFRHENAMLQEYLLYLVEVGLEQVEAEIGDRLIKPVDDPREEPTESAN